MVRLKKKVNFPDIDYDEAALWINKFYQNPDIFPYLTPYSYQNYPLINATSYTYTYYGSNYERLVLTKNKWDTPDSLYPEGFFHYSQGLLHNISEPQELIVNTEAQK